MSGCAWTSARARRSRASPSVTSWSPTPSSTRARARRHPSTGTTPPTSRCATAAFTTSTRGSCSVMRTTSSGRTTAARATTPSPISPPPTATPDTSTSSARARWRSSGSASGWEMDAYQFLSEGNTLTQNRFGIEHYTGVQESMIVHNTLTDDGPIWLRSQVHRQAPVDLSPVWDNLIAENAVSANDHQEYDTAGIGVIDDELAGPLVGAMVLGNEVRRNTIHAQIPNLRFPSSGNIEDGYWAWTRDESNSDDIPSDDTTMATVATIFDGNQTYDAAYPYWVDTGTYSTVIANHGGGNSGESPRDMTGAGAGHASVDPVVSRGGGPVPRATAPASAGSSPRTGGGLPLMGVGLTAGGSAGVGVLCAWARRRNRGV